MHSHFEEFENAQKEIVLILVVMEDALALMIREPKEDARVVLILVVMEDALARPELILLQPSTTRS